MTVDGVVVAAARMAPMALLSPALGRGVLPRAVVAAALTLAVAGSVTATVGLAPALVVRELGIGLLLTLAVSAPFWAAELAGRLVDHARGTTARGPLDAGMALWALALWCAVGGPRLWVAAAAATYSAVPLTAPGSSVTAVSLVDAAGRLFGAGLAMAAPALAVLLVVDLGSALLFRDGGLRSWTAIGTVAVTAAAALAVLGRELGALKAFGL